MKQKTIGIISLMTVMLFAMTTGVLAGDFKIQSPVGTNIFTVSTAGNVNASGTIMESNVLLSDTYWKIATVASPSDGDSTHLSTADQIYDWVIGLGYTAGWDTLDDMVLTEAYIYVGNSSNEPEGVAVSGDATLTAAGVLTLDADIMRDAEIETWGYWNESGDLADDELAEAKIAFSTACAAGSHYYLNGNDLACETDDDTTYTANSPLNLTGTVFDLINCDDNQIWKMDGTTWTCEADGGSGISAIVEDTNATLGSRLDLNGFAINNGDGNTNMTIDATGNFIIVLS